MNAFYLSYNCGSTIRLHNCQFVKVYTVSPIKYPSMEYKSDVFGRIAIVKFVIVILIVGFGVKVISNEFVLIALYSVSNLFAMSNVLSFVVNIWKLFIGKLAKSMSLENVIVATILLLSLLRDIEMVAVTQ